MPAGSRTWPWSRRRPGRTIFLTTHDMTLADELCDRVAFLVDGRIAALDAPRELRLRHGRRAVAVEYERRRPGRAPGVRPGRPGRRPGVPGHPPLRRGAEACTRRRPRWRTCSCGSPGGGSRHEPPRRRRRLRCPAPVPQRLLRRRRLRRRRPRPAAPPGARPLRRLADADAGPGQHAGQHLLLHRRPGPAGEGRGVAGGAGRHAAAAGRVPRLEGHHAGPAVAGRSPGDRAAGPRGGLPPRGASPPGSA